MNKIVLSFVFFLLLITCFAQQTSAVINYNYNTIKFNPAYAGYYKNTDISITNTNFLKSVEGSPQTFSLMVNSPTNNEKVGLGFGFVSDKIGLLKTNSYFASFALKIPFDNGGPNGHWWDFFWNKCRVCST